MSRRTRAEKARREASPAAGIKVAISGGSAEQSCLGRESYPSAATAQNGVYVWTLTHDTNLDSVAVYSCLHCDGWHAGTSG